MYFIERSINFTLGLKKFAVYYVKVSAKNEQGKGPFSDLVSVQTLEDGVLET